jgi:hypothetical protein
MPQALLIQVHNACKEADTCALVVDTEHWQTVVEEEEITLWNTGKGDSKLSHFGVDHSPGVGDFCKHLYIHKACREGAWFPVNGVPVFFMWRMNKDGFPPDEMHPYHAAKGSKA